MTEMNLVKQYTYSFNEK